MKLRASDRSGLRRRSPPPTGAWIETCSVLGNLLAQNRRPLPRGRGLKLQRTQRFGVRHPSPPPTGAWIETCSVLGNLLAQNVAPSHGGVD